MKGFALGVIPARWGSTRFPGKILVPVAGRPLIHWVIDRVRRARLLDDLVVATDDGRIADAVAPLGVTVAMTRADHPSGTDRVAEAIAGKPADVVVNIQGDEPLIDPGLIDRLVRKLLDDASWDMATAAEPLVDVSLTGLSSVVKVVLDRNGQALYFSRAVIPFERDAPSAGSSPVSRWRHVGIYAYRRTFLERLVREPPCALEQVEKLEQLRALYLGGRIAVLSAEGQGGLGIDTPEDVARVEALLSSDAKRS